MGSHIMKTTIEISDDLFARVRQLARKEKTTFRALTEAGLRMVLKEKQSKTTKWKWKPTTFRGGALTDEFKNADWEKIRDEIYRSHGA
jgi:predicted transcriptional regulator